MCVMSMYTFTITTVVPEVCFLSFFQHSEYVGVHTQLLAKLYWIVTIVAKLATAQDKNFTVHKVDPSYTSITTQSVL